MADLKDLLKSMVVGTAETFRSRSDPKQRRLVVRCCEELHLDREWREWHIRQYWLMPPDAHLHPIDADDWERVP